MCGSQLADINIFLLHLISNANCQKLPATYFYSVMESCMWRQCSRKLNLWRSRADFLKCPKCQGEVDSVIFDEQGCAQFGR